MSVSNLAVLILVLPAFSALMCGLFGKQLRHLSGVLAAACMLGTFFCTAVLFFAVPKEGMSILLWDFMQLNVGDFQFNIEAKLWLDHLTLVMLFIISSVGSMVFIYSNGYMHHDEHSSPGAPRFFAYLSLFAFSMYLLVLGANFIMMFIGWEGVGLCSYLLIGYYYDQPFDDEISCADAGKKAFIVNRIGDFGFIMGIFFVMFYFGTLDFHDVTHSAKDVFLGLGSGATIIFTTISLLLFIGATGKSAQIPLYFWLPDAMAGPTPVSALIHAATMVTAGVYMLARLNVLFVLAEYALPVVAIIGGLTAFIAATIAITQTDIKKILAYSTVSQLGYMFLACGVGAFDAGIFHVFTHAFFKGCLFLCAGSVIHAMHHQQDVFKMGGLKEKMPTTCWTYWIATLAIAGVPFLSGFFSKDEILWKTLSHGGILYIFLWIMGVVTAFLTAFYMYRSYILTFEGETRADKHAWEHVHESPFSMTFPLVFLAYGAILVGYVGLPKWIPILGYLPDWVMLKTHYFQDYLYPVTKYGAKTYAEVQEILHHTHAHEHAHGFFYYLMEFVLAVFSAGVAIAGIFFAKHVYEKNFPALPAKLAGQYKQAFNLSANLWYYNWFCMKVVVGILMGFYHFMLFLDKYLIDGIVHGTGFMAKRIGLEFRQMQSGQVQAYAFWILIGVNFIILIFIFHFLRA